MRTTTAWTVLLALCAAAGCAGDPLARLPALDDRAGACRLSALALVDEYLAALDPDQRVAFLHTVWRVGLRQAAAGAPLPRFVTCGPDERVVFRYPGTDAGGKPCTVESRFARYGRKTFSEGDWEVCSAWAVAVTQGLWLHAALPSASPDAPELEALRKDRGPPRRFSGCDLLPPYLLIMEPDCWPAPAPAPARRRPAQVWVPRLHFDGTRLADAIQFFRDFSGLTIEADWPALKKVGVGPTTPVTVKLDGAFMDAALWAVLDSAAPGRLVYRQPPQVVISTRQARTRPSDGR